MSLMFLSCRMSNRTECMRLHLRCALSAVAIFLGMTGNALADFNAASIAYLNGNPAVLREGLQRLIEERRDVETLRWFEQLYDGPGQGRLRNFAHADQMLMVDAVRGAVDRTRDPHAMYRLSLLYQMFGNKSEERLWLSRAAAVGYIHRPSNGGQPVHAKYLYGQMLGLAGEFDGALAEMETALAAGDTEAEVWLISQYARGTPLASTEYSGRRMVLGPPANPRRAAELIVNRANRVLADPNQFSNSKARALEALGTVKIWDSSDPSALIEALALFQRAWDLDISSVAPREIVNLLRRGVGNYSDAERQALVREWTSRRIQMDARRSVVH